MSCFDSTHAPVATAAHAAATGLVSMSTRPDPEGSGTVEIATPRCPRLRVVWDLRELTHSSRNIFYDCKKKTTLTPSNLSQKMVCRVKIGQFGYIRQIFTHKCCSEHARAFDGSSPYNYPPTYCSSRTERDARRTGGHAGRPVQ